MAKDKKNKRVFKRLDDMLDNWGTGNVSDKPSPIHVQQSNDGSLKPPKISRQSEIASMRKPEIKQEEEKKEETSKPKQETMTSVKKRVDKIVKEHLDNLPPATRVVTAKDIRKWVLENPSLNVNSPQFLAWCRNPDGDGVCPYVKHFGQLLIDLGIEHSCDVDVRGYVYDFFVEPMNLYIDIDPISLETDDPNAKISITVNKNRVDVLGIWRTINDSRPTRCKPYRFMALKERLYAQGVKEFVQEYLDWYYQQMLKAEEKR